MGDATWTVTESDTRIARTGIMMQAQAHGLDMEDGNLAEFLEHQIAVRAASLAEARFNSNAIQRITAQGHWATGGCNHTHVPQEDM